MKRTTHLLASAIATGSRFGEPVRVGAIFDALTLLKEMGASAHACTRSDKHTSSQEDVHYEE